MLKICVSVVRTVHRAKLQFLLAMLLSNQVELVFQQSGLALIIFEPLLKTRRGNHYVLVISEYFTCWVEAYGLPASIVVKTLVEEWIYRFGAPDLIHSD